MLRFALIEVLFQVALKDVFVSRRELLLLTCLFLFTYLTHFVSTIKYASDDLDESIAQVPWSADLLHDHKGATPLASIRSRIVCKLKRILLLTWFVASLGCWLMSLLWAHHETLMLQKLATMSNWLQSLPLLQGGWFNLLQTVLIILLLTKLFSFMSKYLQKSRR